MVDQGPKDNRARFTRELGGTTTATASRTALWTALLTALLSASLACKTDRSEQEPPSGADKPGSEQPEKGTAGTPADKAKSKTAESKPAVSTPRERHSYYTRGVHNRVGCVPPQKCIAKRQPGQPSDPQFPPYWTSEWTMYRVYDNYEK